MDLRAELCRVVAADRVLTREIDRVAWANDASVYRLVPQAVVLPQDVEEVRGLLALSRRCRVPLTFRAAGTSLSGQAVTDGVLAVLARHWRGVEVRDGGARVWVQPGIVGGVVNRHLRPHGAKIGPDPASINACMMGGILANNSSGMCCGVEQNAYHTLTAMRFVLPDGVVVDSSAPDAAAAFARDCPDLAAGLVDLRRRIVDDATLSASIRRKYGMKNTMGYSLNAFLDYESPLDIMTHLMIGSEGTLGFIADAELATVPDHPQKSTGLLFFDDVPDACTAIAPLRDSGARALELMDRASLRAIQDEPGVPDGIAELPPAAAALLVEYQCADEAELVDRQTACERLLSDLPLSREAAFTRDADRQAALWRVRKGLIPSVGAMRAPGTSFIIEDVVYPVAALADGVRDLQGLFARFGYDDAIVFGHAKDGNLHFVLTQAFEQEADVERYDGFMRALADNVAGRHGGALKAEHGTGRNMAPFVAAEWGRTAWSLMRELKHLVDPGGLLNPGVIINEDPRAHVTHLKALPRVEPEINDCIECGFCESLCPSRDLTLTPRQRIVVRREMARLRASAPDSPALAELERDYRHAAVETCAADGLCAMACPVGIDTGAFVKQLRHAAIDDTGHELAAIAADRFGSIERCARGGLRGMRLLERVAGVASAEWLGRTIHRWSRGALPPWSRDLPGAARAPRMRDTSTGDVETEAIYFPTCVSRVLADPGARDGAGLAETVLRVSRRARLGLRIAGETGRCCGMAFASKGQREAYRRAVRRTVASLWDASDRGRLPVVVDASPCALTLKQAAPDLPGALRERYASMRILDAVEWAHERVLPRLPARRKLGRVALHPVCSVRKMELVATFEAVAKAYADKADVPIAAGCCGFAGDRGLAIPQLPAAALAPEVRELAAHAYDGCYSSSATCEIGLRRETGKPYRSFWHLIDDATR